MSDVAIRVEDLGKQYQIGRQQARYKTIRETLIDGVMTPFRRAGRIARGRGSAADLDETIWALKDVSFEVKRGDVVGVIGRNGAGKTTLLKILSRITEPTEGNAWIHGRVGSLLEVGTGFHPELTGRENIYLNGAILGMRRNEIDRKFDEITDFAEIEKFLDTPVKHYSSGMYVRLAFSVAAHLEPEILLVDEVLAVGDAGFQRKCLGKLSDVASIGRTVLFVSHNIKAIRSLCHTGYWIEKGNIKQSGNINDVADSYIRESMESDDLTCRVKWVDKDAPGSEFIKCLSVSLLNDELIPTTVFKSDEIINIEFTYRVFAQLTGFRFRISLLTEDGVIAFSGTDHSIRNWSLDPGLYKSICRVPKSLLNNKRYVIQIAGGIPGVRAHIAPVEVLKFDVEGNSSGSIFPDKNWQGVVSPKLDWTIDIDLGNKSL